jgi:hypothetical protein
VRVGEAEREREGGDVSRKELKIIYFKIFQSNNGFLVCG